MYVTQTVYSLQLSIVINKCSQLHYELYLYLNSAPHRSQAQTIQHNTHRTDHEGTENLAHSCNEKKMFTYYAGVQSKQETSILYEPRVELYKCHDIPRNKKKN